MKKLDDALLAVVVLAAAQIICAMGSMVVLRAIILVLTLAGAE